MAPLGHRGGEHRLRLSDRLRRVLDGVLRAGRSRRRAPGVPRGLYRIGGRRAVLCRPRPGLLVRPGLVHAPRLGPGGHLHDGDLARGGERSGGAPRAGDGDVSGWPLARPGAGARLDGRGDSARRLRARVLAPRVGPDRRGRARLAGRAIDRQCRDAARQRPAIRGRGAEEPAGHAGHRRDTRFIPGSCWGCGRGRRRSWRPASWRRDPS